MAISLKNELKNWAAKQMGASFEKIQGSILRNSNEFGVDPFGFSADFALSGIAPLLWVYKHYHRVKTYGIENVPPGRVLLIANHSGQLPMDAAMIGVALLTEAQPPRAIRSMIEKWAQTLPFVSTYLARMGQIVGTPENCRKLLQQDEAILVFPEGVRGISKLYKDRYKLCEFGQGFVRLALETKTPIVPIAVIGAEEQAPTVFHFQPLASLLNFPVFPITITGVPIPLPTRYHIYFGPPIHLTTNGHEEDIDVERMSLDVKSKIQLMISAGLKARKHIFR